jgi:hypothetical protein
MAKGKLRKNEFWAVWDKVTDTFVPAGGLYADKLSAEIIAGQYSSGMCASLVKIIPIKGKNR